MKFKSKLSSVTMSLALLAVSFLSVASQKIEVSAASEPSETVETRLKDGYFSDTKTENNYKKDLADVKNLSDGVTLSKEEYMQIKNLIESVSSFHKWTVFSFLTVIGFQLTATLLTVSGLPILAVITTLVGTGIVVTGGVMILVRALQIAALV